METYNIIIPAIDRDKLIFEFKQMKSEYADRIHAEIKARYKVVFDDIQSGKADTATYSKGSNVYSLTRSAKNPGAVQLTTFWNRNGELLPASDHQLYNFSDMDTADMLSNLEITITAF